VRLLTDKQVTLLNYVKEGKTNKQIAEHLGKSSRTIRDYLTDIYRRLGASNRLEAVTSAVRKGYLDLDEINLVEKPRQHRTKILEGQTVKIPTGCGSMYVMMNHDKEGKIIEVFAQLGRAGTCARCNNEAITRCITTGLKYGVPVTEYIKQLSGIQCNIPTWHEGYNIKSCPDALSMILRDFVELGNNE